MCTAGFETRAFAIIMNKRKKNMQKASSYFLHRKRAPRRNLSDARKSFLYFIVSAEPFFDNFVYGGTVFNVLRARSKAERGIDNAPPVVARARTEFYNQRVV